MKQKIARGMGTLAATGIGSWIFIGGRAWVALAIMAVAITVVLGFLVVFCRAPEGQRRDLIDLFHGHPEKDNRDE